MIEKPTIKNPTFVRIYKFVWFDNGRLKDIKIVTDSIHSALYAFYTRFYMFDHNIGRIHVYIAYDYTEEYQHICTIKE